ncbi:hypothetical protein HDU81_007709 [Chytriomyces hyalinus]|nr:hypothetical protein HDU81_007709 [Chytriomyces hyalinus]
MRVAESGKNDWGEPFPALLLQKPGFLEQRNSKSGRGPRFPPSRDTLQSFPIVEHPAKPGFISFRGKKRANMPAPVENIAYMDAVELKPTTQQLKAAAAATMKETSSVENNKKTLKPHVLVAETQAGYFANKFI